MKNFQNPWGNNNADFKQWFTNDWGQGGKHDAVSKTGGDNALESATFEAPYIIYGAEFTPPGEDNLDYLGEETLLTLAQNSIPSLLKEDLEIAMHKLQDGTLSFEVFDQFDRHVKERFISEEWTQVEKDRDQITHYIIGYDFRAALMKGTDIMVQHTHINGELGQANVLRKNYEITEEPVGFFDLTRVVNHDIPLYQPKLKPDGPLIRTAGYLTMWFMPYNDKSRNIMVKMTVGEIER